MCRPRMATGHAAEAGSRREPRIDRGATDVIIRWMGLRRCGPVASRLLR